MCAERRLTRRSGSRELEGFSVPFTGPRFNEFVVRGSGRREATCLRVWRRKEISPAACRCLAITQIGRMTFLFA